jgi:hypothetical protein
MKEGAGIIRVCVLLVGDRRSSQQRVTPAAAACRRVELVRVCAWGHINQVLAGLHAALKGKGRPPAPAAEAAAAMSVCSHGTIRNGHTTGGWARNEA